ncbi:MAG TPA: FAD-dependent monooxygenase [Propionibacteriaceae bacterium]|nr:FAD-dependent monooxygenase [Propionibacteriaceae bacterium]
MPSSAPARPLLLLHLLAADGVESVALETRSREYVAARIRAGVLETSTVEVLAACGLDGRLRSPRRWPP